MPFVPGERPSCAHRIDAIAAPAPCWRLPPQSGRNNVKLNYILSELQKSGVEPILNLTRTESYQYSGWGGKWEQWQFAYVMAYHAAKDYDVQRFQWYNEPNQSSSTISVADYT